MEQEASIGSRKNQLDPAQRRANKIEIGENSAWQRSDRQQLKKEAENGTFYSKRMARIVSI